MAVACLVRAAPAICRFETKVLAVNRIRRSGETVQINMLHQAVQCETTRMRAQRLQPDRRHTCPLYASIMVEYCTLPY